MFYSLLTIILVAQSGLISGRVVDAVSGVPVGGANVVLAGTGIGAATRDSGGFVIGTVKPGRYRMVTSHIAFEPETTEIEVFPDFVLRPVVRLKAKVIPMPEVKSRSERREPGEKVTVREISSEQLQRNAGGFVQDPVRSLSFLPGVAHSARGEWSGTYAVRGGEPDESSVWFGSTELLWPYHLLGFSSVVNSDLIEKISFYPSVFPVRYGGALSSIAVFKPKQLDKGEGFWAYDPMNMKAAYSGSLDDIQFLASYRRTFYYVLFGPMGAGQGTSKPTYSDILGQVSFPLGRQSRLRVTGVSGNDHIYSTLLGIDEEMTEAGSSFSGGIESDWGGVMSEISLYSNTHDFTLYPSVWWGVATTRQQEVGLRLSLSGTLASGIDLDCGAELGRVSYVGNLLSPVVLQRGDNANAAYAALSVRPASLFGIDVGLRYEDVRWALDKVIEPRAVASLYLADGFALRAGYRRLHQHSYSFLRNSCASFVFDRQYDDYRLFEQGALKAKAAEHYSVAAELRPTRTTVVTVEGYVKDYSNLPTWQVDKQGQLGEVGNNGLGFARGVEATLEQSEVAGFSGWLTYGLASCRKQQGTDTMVYWDKYDRRHSFGATLQKRFRGDWSVGVTFHLNTGAPYTPLLYTQSPHELGSADLNRGHSAYVIEGEKNSARVPTYHRLDLKLSKELPKLPLHPNMYIEILNVYNQQNVYNLVQFEDREGNIVTGQSTGIPFIPLIGIGGRF